LRALRKAKGLTQEELAGNLNRQFGTKITRTTINKWENETHEPLLNQAKKVAEFFGVSLDYMVGQSDVKEIKTPAPGGVGAWLDGQLSRAMEIEAQLSPEDLEKWFDHGELLKLRHKP